MAKNSKSANTDRMKLISGEAKKLYEASTNMKWTDAVKKASAALKKQGKI